MTTLREHEEHRWGYMDTGQLLRRIGRMRRRDKLQMTCTIAFERGNRRVLRAASDQLVNLGYSHVVRDEWLDEDDEAVDRSITSTISPAQLRARRKENIRTGKIKPRKKKKKPAHTGKHRIIR